MWGQEQGRRGKLALLERSVCLWINWKGIHSMNCEAYGWRMRLLPYGRPVREHQKKTNSSGTKPEILFLSLNIGRRPNLFLIYPAKGRGFGIIVITILRRRGRCGGVGKGYGLNWERPGVIGVPLCNSLWRSIGYQVPSGNETFLWAIGCRSWSGPNPWLIDCLLITRRRLKWEGTLSFDIQSRLFIAHLICHVV